LSAALPGIERRNAWAFYSMFLVSLVATLYAVVAPQLGLLGQSGFGLLDYGLPWLFAAALWLRAGLASLRLYQVRIRALVGWREWLRDPMAVLGVPPLRSRVAPLVWFLALFFGLSGAALAQGAPGGSPSTVMGVITAPIQQTDLAFNWLQRLFPALADMAGGQASEADPLKPMLMLFNGLLLLVGMGLLMFHTLSATVYAAHSGRSIGQGKYHGLWSPLRILAGVTFLAPIKGYCAAQFLVLKVIVIGYSLANGMWATYVDKMMSADQVSVMPGVNSGPGLSTAIKVLELEACATTIQTYSQNMTRARSWSPESWFRSSRASAQLPPAEGALQSLTIRNSEAEEFGLGPATFDHIWDYGSICGNMQMTRPSLASGATAAEKAAFESFSEAKIQALRNLVNAVRNTRIAQTMMARVTPGASPAEITNQPVGPWAELGRAAEQYNREIQQAGRALVNQLNGTHKNALKETAQKLGWASAGTLNMTLTRLSSQAARYMSEAVPSVTSPTLDGVQTEGAATEQMRILREMMAFLRASLREMQGHYDVRSADVQASRDTAQSTYFPSDIARVIRQVSQSWALGIQDTTRLDPLRPMESIQNVGNVALGIGQAGLLGISAVKLATGNIIGSSTGAKSVSDFWASIFTSIIVGLMIFGALHVYILPFIPYIIWFYAVIGTAAMAVELMLAAPLAALQHIKADGEDFADQKQQTFYLMAFNALLKPTLLLFGLVTASIMFVVMANFLNTTLGLAFVSAQGDSVIGLVGIFTMLVISFYIHYQLCVRSFALITKVPEAVADLLGVRDGNRGEHGDSDTIIGGVVSFTQKGMGQTATLTAIGKNKGRSNGRPDGEPDQGGTDGAAPSANAAALNPASAKGGAAPSGKGEK
jgi:conjugal transfer/type IV secretion protein DotA/TraY